MDDFGSVIDFDSFDPEKKKKQGEIGEVVDFSLPEVPAVTAPSSYKDPVYDDWEAKAAEEFGVPKPVISAIRLAGERSNPDQVSEAGARSAYQFIPATRKAVMDKYGIDPWESEAEAARAAAALLMENMERNGGDVVEAIGEYHGGGNRNAWGPINQAYRERTARYLSEAYQRALKELPDIQQPKEEVAPVAPADEFMPLLGAEDYQDAPEPPPVVAEAPPPAEEPGYMARLMQGVSSMKNAAKLGVETDPDDIANIIAEESKHRLPETEQQRRMRAEIQPYIDEAKSAEGWDAVGAWAKLAGKTIAEFAKNPDEFGGVVLESLPSSAPGMAGTVAGAAAGSAVGPIGSAVGGIVGGTAGGYLIEHGAAMRDQILAEAQEAGIDPTDPEALEPLIAQRYEHYAEAARKKGLGTAAVDAAMNRLTLGLAGAMKPAKTIAGTVGKGAVVAGTEAVGEGASEAAGQKWAYGVVDPGDVVNEAVVGVGQGAGMAVGGKALNQITGGARAVEPQPAEEIQAAPPVETPPVEPVMEPQAEAPMESQAAEQAVESRPTQPVQPEIGEEVDFEAMQAQMLGIEQTPAVTPEAPPAELPPEAPAPEMQQPAELPPVETPEVAPAEMPPEVAQQPIEEQPPVEPPPMEEPPAPATPEQRLYEFTAEPERMRDIGSDRDELLYLQSVAQDPSASPEQKAGAIEEANRLIDEYEAPAAARAEEANHWATPDEDEYGEPMEVQPLELPADHDEALAAAETYARGVGKVSVPKLQREFGLGYNGARNLALALKERGVVGDYDPEAGVFPVIPKARPQVAAHGSTASPVAVNEAPVRERQASQTPVIKNRPAQTPAQIASFAQGRMVELMNNASRTPEESAELDFLKDSVAKPEAVARAYGARVVDSIAHASGRMAPTFNPSQPLFGAKDDNAQAKVNHVIGRVNKALGGSDKDRLVVPAAEAPEAIRLAPQRREEFKAARAVADALGADMGFMYVPKAAEKKLKAAGMPVPNGVKVGKTVLLNARAENPVTNVAMHEFLHTLKDKHPDLYGYFSDTVVKHSDVGAAIKDFRKTFTDSDAQAMSDSDIIEEFVNDVGGNRMSDPKFLKQLADANPGRFRKMAQQLMSFIDKTLEKLGLPQFKADQFIRKGEENLQAIRDALQSTLEDYDAREAEEEANRAIQEARAQDEEASAAQPEQVAEEAAAPRAAPAPEAGQPAQGEAGPAGTRPKGEGRAARVKFSRKTAQKIVDEVPVVKPSELRGKYIIPIPADLTAAGTLYTGIDSSDIAFPIPTQGGPNFPFIEEYKDKGIAWATHGLAEARKQMGKKTPKGEPVYAVVVAMGQDSHISNATVTNAIIQTLEAHVRDGRVTRDELDAIDGMIREKIGRGTRVVKEEGKEDRYEPFTYDFKDMPSLHNLGTPEGNAAFEKYVAHDLTFDRRQVFNEMLNTVKARELGMPNVQKILDATRDPEFGGMNMGDALLVIKLPKLDSDAIVKAEDIGVTPHASYERLLRGEVVGKLSRPINYKDLFPDFFKKRRDAGKGESADNIAFRRGLPLQEMRDDVLAGFADELPAKDPANAKAALDFATGNWRSTDVAKKDGGASPADFAAAIDGSPSSAVLDPYTLDDLRKLKKSMRVFQLGDRRIFFGLKSTGSDVELVGMVNNEPSVKGVMPAMVLKAIEEGATTVSTFDLKLPAAFEALGFRAESREAFNPDKITATSDLERKLRVRDMERIFRAKGWEPQLDNDGRITNYPDVVTMRWAGADSDRKGITDRYLKTGEWSTGKAAPPKMRETALGIAKMGERDARTYGLDDQQIERLRGNLRESGIKFSRKALPAADRVKWRDIADVKKDIALDKLPAHITPFAEFMRYMAQKAEAGAMSPRDLRKAYAITRSSVNRQAVATEKARAAGLKLPESFNEKTIRPEGAFSYWLLSPEGQAYLNAADEGRVHEPSIENIREVFKPFGMANTLAEDLRRSVTQGFEELAQTVSDLVKRAAKGENVVRDWQKAVDGLHGIGYAKKGFFGALLGYGQLPTFDARQINVQVQPESKEDVLSALGSKRAPELVDKLMARLDALDMTMDPLYRPFKQHLVHHAVWDKVGSSETTHSDVVDAMMKFSRADLTEKAKLFVKDRMETSKKFNWWHNTVGTQYHKAMRHPGFKKVFDGVQTFLKDTTVYALRAEGMAPNILTRLESFPDIARDIRRAVKDRTFDSLPHADRKALAAAIYTGTLSGVRYTQAELRAGIDDGTGNIVKLNARQIDLYHQYLDAVNTSLDDLAKSEIVKALNMAKANADGLMELPFQAAAKEAKNRIEADVVKQLKDKIAKMRFNNAPPMATFLARVNKETTVKGVLDEFKQTHGNFDYLVKELEEVAQPVSLIDRHMEMRKKLYDNGYVPLMRFGRYYLDIKGADGKTRYFSLFESEAEANRMHRELSDTLDPGETISKGVMSQEEFKLFKGTTPESMAMFASKADLQGDELLQKWLKLSMSNRSTMKRLIKRKGTEGYSEDVTRALASFIASNARKTSANLHQLDIDRAAGDIKDGDVKDDAIRLKDYVQNPIEEASGLRSFMFAHYMGGSIAAGLTNMTQPIMMTYPYLSKYGAGKAAAELTKSLGLASKAAAGRKIKLLGNIGKALERAEREGVVAPHEIHMLQATARGVGQGSKALERMSKLWGSFFAVSESFNRYSTFIAAYRLSEAAGEADPYAAAEQAVYETQGIYNKGNRPNWARGAVGATLFTFKQFGIAYLEFLRRLPRRQALMALGILALFSGVEGLPFKDDLNDVIDALAGKLGYGWNTEFQQQKLLDAMLGRSAANFVLYGMSGFLPFDLSGRLSMGNVIPGTGILNPAKQDRLGEEVAEPLGAAGGVAKGILKAADGEWKEGLPKAVRDVLKGADIAATGKIRDTRDGTITEGNAVDAVVQGIGFNPTKKAESGRVRGMNYAMSTIYRNKQAEANELMARAIVNKDEKAKKKAREMVREWNEANPEMKLLLNPAAIQRRVIEKKLEADKRQFKHLPKAMRQGVLSVEVDEEESDE